MPTNTERLDLFKYDVVADANNTFNITKALNENWDKIDANVAKEQDIDGMWRQSTISLVREGTLSQTYNKTFDLSNYLPNDEQPYLVFIDTIIRTGTTNNNTFGLYAKSSIIKNFSCICRAVTRVANTNQIAGGSCIFPVGADHTITFAAGEETNASSFANSCNISLNGFRKVR